MRKLIRSFLIYGNLFLLTLFTPYSTCFSMDDDIKVEEDYRSSVQKKREGREINEESLIIDNSFSEIQEANFSKTIPYLDINPKQPTRRKLNNSIENIWSDQNLRKKNLGLAKKVEAEGNPYSSILIYRNKLPSSNNTNPPPWSQTNLFLRELDQCVFKKKSSSLRNASRILTVPFSLAVGSIEPGAVVALNWYLGEDLFTFIPVAGPLSKLITYSSIAVLLPTCIAQTLTWTENTGDWVFRNNKLTPSKESDYKPHVLKLGATIERDKAWCCKTIKIPTSLLYAVSSLMDAAVVALPYCLLFREAEDVYFSTYYDIAAIPLALFYFENTLKNNFKFFKKHELQRKSEEDNMVRLKKSILQSRLKLMASFLKSNNSVKLVNELFDLMQRELHKNHGSEDKYISIFSALFLKTVKSEAFSTLLNALKERPDSFELNSVNNEYLENVDALAEMPIQPIANLVTDIDKLPPKTYMRNFLEALATWQNGLSTVGGLVVNAWAIEQVALACGLDPTNATVISYVGAAMHGAFSALTQSNVQEKTFLGFRHFGSRDRDFWALRWIANTTSALTAGLLSVPYPAIIYNVLESAPAPVTFCLAASTVPTQWCTFYDFMQGYLNTVITKVVTTVSMKTTAQKRAWLINQINEATKLVDEFDKSTTEQWYNLTQDGL